MVRLFGMSENSRSSPRQTGPSVNVKPVATRSSIGTRRRKSGDASSSRYSTNRTSLPGWLRFDFYDHLDLDRDAARQRLHTDRRASVAAFVAEDTHQQVG